MKASSEPKKQPKKDWHKADIIAALSKKGWSLSKLSIHHEYARTTLAKVLRLPWPKGQRFIAEAIGVPPQKIWPSRYPSNDYNADPSTKTKAAA